MARLVTCALLCILLTGFSCHGLLLGLLPLAAVGLVGVKLYLGMHLLGVGTMFVSKQLGRIDLGLPTEDDDPTPTTPLPLVKHRARRAGQEPSKPPLPPIPSNLAPRLNPEMLEFIHEIDDDQCFEKFFCELGADRKAFGTFGARIALVLDFYLSDPEAWYSKAMQNGQKLANKKLCPGKCESDDIRKMVDYVSKQLFNGKNRR